MFKRRENRQGREGESKNHIYIEKQREPKT